MSAGTFEFSKYETSEGEIRPFRVQPETLALTIDGTANAAPSGATTSNESVRRGTSRRSYGVTVRRVGIRFTAAPPTGYAANQTLTIPILQASVWNGISRGDTGTYLGTACVVRFKRAEEIK